MIDTCMGSQCHGAISIMIVVGKCISLSEGLNKKGTCRKSKHLFNKINQQGETT